MELHCRSTRWSAAEPEVFAVALENQFWLGHASTGNLSLGLIGAWKGHSLPGSLLFYFAARTFRHHARSRVRRLYDMSRVRGM